MIPTFYMQIICKLKEETPYQEAPEKINKGFNECLLYDKKLKTLHEQRGYKGYISSSLSPREQDKIYKPNKEYRMVIRSYSKELLEKLKIGLERNINPYIEIVSVGEVRKMKDKHISELKTLTPAIATVFEDNKTNPFLLEKHGIKLLKERIVANLEKKFKSFYGKEINGSSFIKGIEMLSSLPIATKYKGKSLLGYKMKIFVGDDYESQQLARLAIATGILEKGSSIGAGFIEIH